MVTRRDIKAARLRLGESQAAFAKRLGVHQSTVHIWETEGLPEHGPAKLAVESFLKELARMPRVAGDTA